MISSRSRLLNMPEVFSIAELARVMQVNRMRASQYVWRWGASDLVAPFGGQSGIFLNLVRCPNGRSDGSLWERALLKAMPSAIIGGYEVLAECGLSTQVTHQRFVLVSNTDSLFQVDGAEVHRRPVPWLNRLARSGAIVDADPGLLVPRLRPGAALADLALYAERRPDPDDIDMEMIASDEVELFSKLSGAQAIEDVSTKRAPAKRYAM
jgi:hypothetical protein